MAIFDDLLARGVTQIIDKPSLEQKLKSGKPLCVKHGVDPTTKDLHLGQAVIYRKLRQFQQLGHMIIFLIGDFTARFGDPTDRQVNRQLRSKKEVMECARKYLKQIAKILDPKKTQIRFNGEWYDKMSAEELLKLEANFSFAQVIERDMFQERLRRKQDIRLHELTYPILQGYDSVMLKADLTIIGTDQIFNEFQGRRLQTVFGQEPQDIIAMKLLPGTDGKMKMSQSLGNDIKFSESSTEMFGKIMSLPDEVILDYFELCTDVDLETIKRDLDGGVNPRDVKARLALEITGFYHGTKIASQTEEEFNRIYRDQKLPQTMASVRLQRQNIKLEELLASVQLASSKSAARRLIEQGAVEIDSKKISDPRAEIGLHDNMVLKVGKHKFLKINLY